MKKNDGKQQFSTVSILTEEERKAFNKFAIQKVSDQLPAGMIVVDFDGGNVRVFKAEEIFNFSQDLVIEFLASKG